MATLRIYDLDGGVLAVHLSRLLDLLAPKSLDAEWTVAQLRSDGEDKFEATGSGAAELEELVATAMPISGMALLIVATNTHQIVWGEFIAIVPGESTPWLTLRAIDSTFYEIGTDDADALAKIKSAYKDVRIADTP
ncbi:hypothetical protein [uncultured Hyphomicrobium sp.]|uniref:hypothetical protein n=1 Tax=uncultured Hyphomicrobium sp. TaxID=194373 RepID=UPI0025E825B1|nr:hypothetical protein [uncultured Hyphomicrobium sp.]